MNKEDIKEGYTRVSDFCARYESFDAVDKEYLKHRQDIGINVHQAIECTLNFIPFTLMEEAKPYYESWFKWYDKCHPEIIHTEKRLYCDKFMLTGAVDGIMSYQWHKDLCICDWKCTSWANLDMWTLKGTFYHHLVKSNNLCKISDRFFYVQLDKEGGYPKIHELETNQKWRSLMVATIMSKQFEDKQKGRRFTKNEQN